MSFTALCGRILWLYWLGYLAAGALLGVLALLGTRPFDADRVDGVILVVVAFCALQASWWQEYGRAAVSIVRFGGGVRFLRMGRWHVRLRTQALHPKCWAWRPKLSDSIEPRLKVAVHVRLFGPISVLEQFEPAEWPTRTYDASTDRFLVLGTDRQWHPEPVLPYVDAIVNGTGCWVSGCTRTGVAFRWVSQQHRFQVCKHHLEFADILFDPTPVQFMVTTQGWKTAQPADFPFQPIEGATIRSNDA